jgi:hypothetical protein
MGVIGVRAGKRKEPFVNERGHRVTDRMADDRVMLGAHKIPPFGYQVIYSKFDRM